MDHFSKCCEEYTLREHCAPTVARVLIDKLFNRFAHPVQILSNQGKEFDEQLAHDLYRWMEIDKIRARASSYREACNGMVDRFHRTLNVMLAKFVADNQRDWDTKIPLVMAANLAFINDKTDYALNFLMFDREV